MCVVVVGATFYASIAWGAFTFFRVSNQGALSGKRALSILGGLAAVTALYQLWSNPCNQIERVLAALAVYGLAILAFWSAIAATRVQGIDFAFSTATPQIVQRGGPYRLIRHPFYTSYILGWLAPWIYTGTGVSGATFLLVSVVYTWVALAEEKSLLRSAVAKDYEAYRRSTARFIPWCL
jgi:protein-S-isoprenylcysteine O-methyltransferase Ste14